MMRRVYSLSLVLLGLVSGVTIILASSPSARAQVQGSLPAFVRLQTSTPGLPQAGHSNITGTTVSGQFVGGGAGLTGLSASALLTGTVSDARLSSNVALLGATGQVFSVAKTFSAFPTFSNASVPFLVSSTGKVSNLNADLLDNQTGAYYQDATNLNAGTVADARLSVNVANLNTNQTFTGQKVFSQFPAFTNVTPFSVTSTNMVGNLNVQYLNGQASGFYTNATNLTTGTLSDSRLSTNVATLASVQTFSGQKTFSANLKLPAGAQSGHVLTSDATGTATWQAPTVAPGTALVSNSKTPPSGYVYTGLALETENTAESLGTIPANLTGGHVAGYGTKIYVAGVITVGEQGYRKFYSYDTVSGVTTELATPIMADSITLVAGLGVVYAVARDYKSEGKVYVYDVSSNTWSYTTSLPFDGSNVRDWSVGCIGSDLLVFGGRNSATGEARLSTYMWRGGAWQTKGNLNVPRVGCAALSANGTVYLFGGGTNAIEAYIDFSNSWVYLEPFMPAQFNRCQAAFMNRNGADEIAVFNNTQGFRAKVSDGLWSESAKVQANPSSVYGYGPHVYYCVDGLKRTALYERQYLHKKT